MAEKQIGPGTQPPKKILVVKLADLGDVLTATPALRALREQFPSAQIDLLLTHHTEAVLQYAPWIDQCLCSANFRIFHWREALKLHLLRQAWQTLHQIRQGEYDTLIFLHHFTSRAGLFKYRFIAWASGAKQVLGLQPQHQQIKFLTQSRPDLGFGKRHEIDYWLDVVGLLGMNTDRQDMHLAIKPAHVVWAKTVLSTHLDRAGGPIILLHPGSGIYSQARRWPAQHFAIVADDLINQGYQVIIVGQPSDDTAAVLGHMHHQALDLTGQTSLHQLAALMQQADLFIGGDSGVTHIAAASGIPMVTVFGPTNAAAWGSRAKTSITLQADIPCCPCAYIEHAVGLRHGCPARTCLKYITPEQVLTAVATLPPLIPPPARREMSILTPTGAPCMARWRGEEKPLNLPREAIPCISILNIRIHTVTFQQTLNLVENFIALDQPHQIVTVNPEFVVQAQHDLVFRQILNRASLAIPDGGGLIKAARWLGQPPIPERVAGVDLVEALARLSAEKGYRLYFLGGQPGVAEKAIAVLCKRYPQCVVVGHYAGSPQAEEEDDIVARIVATQPDIIFVAYGAPNQDKWIARNMYRLPASVLIGVGGSFDFLSGHTQRAPRWIQQRNLEWLHRFISQPTRWRRIWRAVPYFMYLIMRQRIRDFRH